MLPSASRISARSLVIPLFCRMFIRIWKTEKWSSYSRRRSNECTSLSSRGRKCWPQSPKTLGRTSISPLGKERQRQNPGAGPPLSLLRPRLLWRPRWPSVTERSDETENQNNWCLNTRLTRTGFTRWSLRFGVLSFKCCCRAEEDVGFCHRNILLERTLPVVRSSCRAWTSEGWTCNQPQNPFLVDSVLLPLSCGLRRATESLLLLHPS